MKTNKEVPKETLSISIQEDDNTYTSYPIWIGRNLLGGLGDMLPLSNYSSLFVVTDENVSPHWLERVLSSFSTPPKSICLPAGEGAKSIENLSNIWSALQVAGCDRRSLVLNLGGGVIGDMGGFAASTYMRGIDFVQLPTTLLSMVDASVGGKLGVNFGGIKNLVGVFNQPQAVVIDIDTLSTLPTRERNSGFGEIIKHGLIRDLPYFAEVAQRSTETLQEQDWLSLIRRSCSLKAEVVEADVREGGVRKILNFGHTAGHAIESLLLHSDTPLLHGEAVSLGMLVEAELSRLIGHLSSDDVQSIIDVLARYELPTKLPTQLKDEAILAKMLGDKKNVAGDIRWSLLEKVGKASFDVSVELSLISQSLQIIKF